MATVGRPSEPAAGRWAEVVLQSAASWWAGGVAPPRAPPSRSRQMARRLLVTWGAAHRLAVGWARSPGRRADGLRRLAGVLVLDLAAACVRIFHFRHDRQPLDRALEATPGTRPP